MSGNTNFNKMDKRGFAFKTKTVSGDCAKTYCTVYKNGLTYVVTHVLSTKEIIGFEKVTTRFGKTLYRRDHAFKYQSLNTILINATRCLEQMGTKLSDILI